MLIYLDVPYEEKDEAKRLGAKWDAPKKKWYFRGSVNEIHNFEKWMDSKALFTDPNRIYFDVPMSDIDIVKERGAKWDASMKSWYYDGSPDMYYMFADWIDNAGATPSPNLSLQRKIQRLEDELETANSYILSLQMQLETLTITNEELILQLNQPDSNEQFPLFSGCNTKDKLRQRYKLLCKLLHPDNNHENLTKHFQDIQSQYNHLLSITQK